MNDITSPDGRDPVARPRVAGAPDLAAAVDLGSNSFHLLVARLRGGHLVPIERMKEKVQLARGQRDGVLDPAAVARGLGAIGRFAQRLRGIPSERISVAGTAALRDAVNPEAFLAAASGLLGRPVRILSGREEAELIFLGVSHALASEAGGWLVVDVGGGSTEFCLGRPFTPDRSVSVRLGCVSLVEPDPDGMGIAPAKYRAARERASALLGGVARAIGDRRAARVIGTSGTVESVQSVLNANGFSKGPITRDGLEELERAILDRRWIADVGIPGLAPERIDIFPAGVAAVAAIFEALDLESMHYVDATLVNGMLYDLVGRRFAEDVRELAVSHWRTQFDVDVAQAARVKTTAQAIHDGVASPWGIDDERCAELLRWSCDLHEIGLTVSARQPNRHGAYLIENGDLAGFSADDRRALAVLVRASRGGFPNFAFAPFDPATAAQLRRLAVILRLAVALERSRADADSPEIAVRSERVDRLLLELPRGWLETHPLSAAELDAERRRLADVGIRLEISRA